MEYNYREVVCDDIRAYIEEHDIKVTTSTKDDLYQKLYDELFVSDCVTGNASGSYTFNAWTAEENLCHNLDLLKEAYAEFEGTPDLDSPESCDVTIRCYLLAECLSEVFDEIEEEDDEEEEEE